MKRLTLLIATGLYTGYVPLVPGTVASLLAIFLYLIIAPINTAEAHRFWYYTIFLFILSVLAILSANQAEKIFKQKDCRKIVIDEITGFFYAMILLPSSALIIISAFLLFRALDVVKPFPIKQSQRLKGGIGIVIDDILAGVYSCVIIHLIMVLF